jgi:DNA-binding winged helix-turn-helix (wHTH) protein
MGVAARNPIPLRPAATQRRFLEDSVTQIRIVDLKEVQKLSRFVPFVVLVPRSSVQEGDVPFQTSGNNSLGESSATSKILEFLSNAMTQSTARSAENDFVFGDVKVSFSSMEASRQGKPVMLTALEFKTLKYMAQNARRVISRDELLNEVWGYENYPCTRTVDNIILRLRQKLERDPARPAHFRTVQGAGYKFLPKGSTFDRRLQV